MPDQTVVAVGPDGTPIEVPKAGVQSLQQSGGHVMSAAEAQAARRGIELKQKLGGAEGLVAPLAAGAARGLSVGTSDEAILSAAEAIGGHEAREAARQRLNDYQEYAPAASVGGELAGIVGGTLMGDEAALGSLPRAIGRLGAGAERVAARGVGRGILSRGVGLATEGAVYGAGSAVSESTLKDQALTKEALIGGAAHGAAGALVVGGLLHGGGAVLRRAAKVPGAAYEALAGRAFGEAAPGVGREIAPLAEKAGAQSAFDTPASAAIKVGTRGDAEKASQLGDIWKNRQVAFNDAAERVEGHARDVTNAITEQQAASRVTDMATFGDAKTNHMAKLVDRARFDEQANAVRAWATEGQARLADMVGDPNSGLTTAAVKRWDGHIQRIEKALASQDSGLLFKAADDAKRFLGREAQFGRSPFGKSEASRAFDSLYQGDTGLMRVLEHEAWGKAGEAQKAVNAATHDWIGTGQRFRQKFTAQYGDTAGAPDFVGNSEAVSSFMGRLTKASNDLDAQALRDAIQARRSFLNATESSYDHGPAAKSAISKERAALDAMERTFDKASKEAALINQVKRLQSEEQAQRIGGFLGLAADTVTKPVTTLHRIAQLEAHTQSVLGKLSGGTRSLIGGPPAPAQAGLAAPKGSGKGFFSTLLDGASGAAGRAGAVEEPKRAQYQRRAEALTRLQANPQMVADRVGDAIGPYAQVAPKVSAGATATVMAGLAFLASKLPPSRQDPYSLQPQTQTKSRASDAEVARFMRYAQAVDDPLIVLKEAKKGTLTRDHVEAVKEVYPRLYEEMRGEVLRTVVDSRSPLPYSARIQLGILLDIPTDKTLSPDFLTAIQATFSSDEKAGAESPPPTLSRDVNVAGDLQTATQQAVSRAQ